MCVSFCQTRNFAGNEMSAVLSVLAAILHLGNLEVTEHAQSGQSVITNHHELRAGNHVSVYDFKERKHQVTLK